MKRLVFALGAAALLAGCSAAETSTSAVPTETATEVATTASAEATAQTTTAATTEATAEVTTSPSVAEMTDEEWKAVDRVCGKYGRDFTLVDRYVAWESWGEPLPEVLDVSYTLVDDEGLEFCALGKEDTDVITADSYVFAHYEQQFYDEAWEAMHRLLPRGKVHFIQVRNTALPFDSPTDMSYDEFRQAFADNGGELLTYIYVTDDIEVPEELKEYSSISGDGKRGELGYIFKILVDSVSQEDYDSLKDPLTGAPHITDRKIVN
ncbi:MAG: lipoprotein [Ruminococcus sp.]|nr:lipoprotein [Ruminococcus sp.]